MTKKSGSVAGVQFVDETGLIFRLAAKPGTF
jgi:hypothetical protein